MLTFYYDDYKIHIDDAGQTYYARFDGTFGGNLVVIDNPPASIVMLAGQALQLVLTDAVRAKMRVAQLRTELRVAVLDVESADNAESEAHETGLLAKAAQSELDGQLKKAMGALQLIAAGEVLQPSWHEKYNRNGQASAG